MKKTSKLITKGLLAAVLLVSMSANSVSAAGTYKDVPATHKAAESIKYLTEREIITGFTDNTFRPEVAVTRAEASRIITGATTYVGVYYPATNQRKMASFTDLRKNHWYTESITSMYKNRLLNGFSSKSFRPEEAVTKAQLAKIISDAFQMKNVSVKLKYTDVKVKGWYEPAVKNLFAAGIITDSGTQFKPNHKMSRAEVSQYVERAMIFYMDRDDVEPGPNAPIDDSGEELVPWDGTFPF